MRSLFWWKSALILTAACPVSLVCAVAIDGPLGPPVGQNVNWVGQPATDFDIPFPLPLPFVHNPVRPAPTPGHYTFALGAAGNSTGGYGTLSLGAKGNVRLTGTLASGHSFSAGGKLNPQGQYEVAAKVKGDVISGTISFAHTESANISATLHHRRAMGGGMLTAGQPISLTGSLYSPLNNLPLVKLTIQPIESAAIEHRATLASRGIYIVTDAGSDQASLSVSRTTGLLTGRVRLTGKWKNLRGVVLQASANAKGIIQGGGSFGFVAAAAPVEVPDSNTGTTLGGSLQTGATNTSVDPSGNVTGGTVQVDGGQLGAVSFTKVGAGTLTLNNSHLINSAMLQAGTVIASINYGSLSDATLSWVNAGSVIGGTLTLNSGTLTRNPGVLGTLNPADLTFNPSYLGGSLRLATPIVTNGSLNLQDAGGLTLSDGQLRDSSGGVITLPGMLMIAAGTGNGLLDINTGTVGLYNGIRLQLKNSALISLLQLNGGSLVLTANSVENVPVIPVVVTPSAEPAAESIP